MSDYTILVNRPDHKILQWNLTGGDPEGTPFRLLGRCLEFSIQVLGDLGGGVIVLQGTNEVNGSPANWEPLIRFPGSGQSQVSARLYQFRPVLLGGSSGANVTVLVRIAK